MSFTPGMWPLPSLRRAIIYRQPHASDVWVSAHANRARDRRHCCCCRVDGSFWTRHQCAPAKRPPAGDSFPPSSSGSCCQILLLLLPQDRSRALTLDARQAHLTAMKHTHGIATCLPLPCIFTHPPLATPPAALSHSHPRPLVSRNFNGHNGRIQPQRPTKSERLH